MDNIHVHVEDPHPATEEFWHQLEEEGTITVEFDDTPQSYEVRRQLDKATEGSGGYVASIDGENMKVYFFPHRVRSFSAEDITREGEDPDWASV
jgi:hypothetical protein